MIDSVCLTRPVRMHSPLDMLSLGFRSVCKHPSSVCTHPARWRLAREKKPHLTWSEAPNGSHWLSLTGSLPKFMFGSNVYLLSNDDELRTCLEGISQYVAETAQVTFDAFAANVNRVDYCHHWRFSSELVPQYLWALRGISLPRMRKTLIDSSTVELSNASQTIVFYDKFEERFAMKSSTQEELNAAKGVLRFEMRLRDNRSCDRFAKKMGVPNRKAEMLLTEQATRHAIRQTLDRLGLSKPITEGSARLELLRAYCGNDGARFLRLAGFLAAGDYYGLDNLVKLKISSYSDYRRKLKEIKDAGAFLIAEGPRSLEGLTFIEPCKPHQGSEAA